MKFLNIFCNGLTFYKFVYFQKARNSSNLSSLLLWVSNHYWYINLFLLPHYNLDMLLLTMRRQSLFFFFCPCLASKDKCRVIFAWNISVHEFYFVFSCNAVTLFVVQCYILLWFLFCAQPIPISYIYRMWFRQFLCSLCKGFISYIV